MSLNKILAREFYFLTFNATENIFLHQRNISFEQQWIRWHYQILHLGVVAVVLFTLKCFLLWTCQAVAVDFFVLKCGTFYKKSYARSKAIELIDSSHTVSHHDSFTMDSWFHLSVSQHCWMVFIVIRIGLKFEIDLSGNFAKDEIWINSINSFSMINRSICPDIESHQTIYIHNEPVQGTSCPNIFAFRSN